MAIIWQKKVVHNGRSTLYEVRSHGRTRRLYTDGVFHSQYNPSSPVTGSVWDLLLLPAFYHPWGSLQRVLLLGVGGGAVIKQLQYFLQPSLIVGVEINPVHLQVAREHFDVQGSNVVLIEADAIEWLQHYRGPGFDLIIDDLFFEVDGEPGRAVTVDRQWVRWLQNALSATGSIVTNFDTPESMHRSFWLTRPAHESERLYQLTTPSYSNSVLLSTRQTTRQSQFRDNLRRFVELDERRSRCRLNYRMKPLT